MRGTATRQVTMLSTLACLNVFIAGGVTADNGANGRATRGRQCITLASTAFAASVKLSQPPRRRSSFE